MNAPKISKAGSGLPSRVIFHGVEGVGKSSFAAFAPKPIFAMTRGETGLLTLIDNGRVPPTDHFEECSTWHQLTSAVRYLADSQTDNRTLVIDTLNGAERLCFEAVCQDRYQGDWQSFDAYGRGPNVALAEWNEFLTLLDRLRSARRMAIISLCHTKVKAYNNPLGDNYDRYTPDMNEKTWGLAAKWADIVLFGNFEVQVKKANKNDSKAKAVGGEQRVLYTTRTAGFDAKNRTGLPQKIPMGTTADSAWKAFADALQRSRQQGMNAQQRPAAPTSNGGNGSGQKPDARSMLEHWCKKLELTPTDKEEWCQQYGVDTFADLADEDVARMVGEMAEAFAQKQSQTVPAREPGDEPEGDEPEGD